MPYSHLSNAVISTEAHEEAMIQMPVDVRDGDDRIEFNLDVAEIGSEEVDVDRIEINTETGEFSSDEDMDTEELGESDSDELPASGDPKTFEEAGVAIQEAIQGTEEIIQSAIERGLPVEMVETIKAEYNSDEGLSDASYEALAAAGYTKGFIDSYVKGQEAVAAQFVKSIIEYTGGEAAFGKVQDVLSGNGAMADAFNAALDRNDVTTMKALIDSAKATHRQSFGERPKVNLMAAAKPTVVPKAVNAVEPFGSRQEMITAMASREYRTDSAFRAKVEQRLLVSNF